MLFPQIHWIRISFLIKSPGGCDFGPSKVRQPGHFTLELVFSPWCLSEHRKASCREHPSSQVFAQTAQEVSALLGSPGSLNLCIWTVTCDTYLRLSLLDYLLEQASPDNCPFPSPFSHSPRPHILQELLCPIYWIQYTGFIWTHLWSRREKYLLMGPPCQARLSLAQTSHGEGVPYNDIAESLLTQGEGLKTSHRTDKASSTCSWQENLN